MSNNRIKLNNGREIPLMGLGTHRIQNAADIVYNSIKDGIRLIDTATRYGNEVEKGKGIKRALDEGLCKREDLFVVTKIWLSDKSNPEKALRESLKRLELDYIDLYLDHWPCVKDYRTNPSDPFDFVSIDVFWPNMERLVTMGLAKSIGVSNYNVQNLINLLGICKIKPVANQVEFQPYLCQKNLKVFCDKENIAFISYFPLGHGANAKAYIAEHNGEFDIFEEEVVKELAKKYGKTVGQVLLNWHYCLGAIPIPATSKIHRMKENLEALTFKMDEEDVKKLCECFNDKKMRFCGSKKYCGINIFC